MQYVASYPMLVPDLKDAQDEHFATNRFGVEVGYLYDRASKTVQKKEGDTWVGVVGWEAGAISGLVQHLVEQKAQEGNIYSVCDPEQYISVVLREGYSAFFSMDGEKVLAETYYNGEDCVILVHKYIQTLVSVNCCYTHHNKVEILKRFEGRPYELISGFY